MTGQLVLCLEKFHIASVLGSKRKRVGPSEKDKVFLPGPYVGGSPRHPSCAQVTLCQCLGRESGPRGARDCLWWSFGFGAPRHTSPDYLVSIESLVTSVPGPKTFTEHYDDPVYLYWSRNLRYLLFYRLRGLDVGECPAFCVHRGRRSH